MTTKISDINLEHVDKTIRLTATVRSKRIAKFAIFLEIDDGSGLIQCVCNRQKFDEIVLALGKGEVCKQAYIYLEGVVKKLPERAKSFKPVEIEITQILHHSPSNPDLDEHIQEGAKTKAKKDFPHLYGRFDTPVLFAKIHDLVFRSLIKTSEHFGMLHIDAPSYGSVKCEGGSEVFEMNHFGKQVYFTQSSQLYLEDMIGRVKKAVYCCQKSYRAEKSRTKRHLTEFTHYECEMKDFIGPTCFEDFISFLKQFIIKLFEFVQELDTEKLIDRLSGDRRAFILKYMEKPMVTLSHEDAIKLLVEQQIKKPDGSNYGPLDDIPEAAERALIDKLDSIVILTKFPTMTKAFYTKTDETNKERALAADVEFPGVGEIIGSSLREDDYEKLKYKLKLFTLRDIAGDLIEYCETALFADHTIPARKDYINSTIMSQDADALEAALNELIDVIFDAEKKEYFRGLVRDIPYDSYKWYFDLRKYGFQMTGGFGLGVERLVTWIIGPDCEYDITKSTTYVRTCDVTTP
jgi:asparaginyl-tRNA synthetase